MQEKLERFAPKQAKPERILEGKERIAAVFSVLDTIENKFSIWNDKIIIKNFIQSLRSYEEYAEENELQVGNEDTVMVAGSTKVSHGGYIGTGAGIYPAITFRNPEQLEKVKFFSVDSNLNTGAYQVYRHMLSEEGLKIFLREFGCSLSDAENPYKKNAIYKIPHFSLEIIYEFSAKKTRSAEEDQKESILPGHRLLVRFLKPFR